MIRILNKAFLVLITTLLLSSSWIGSVAHAQESPTPEALQNAPTSAEIVEEITTTDIAETQAEQEELIINVFKRDDCKHCQDQEVFLNELVETRNDVRVEYYDIYEETLLWNEFTSSQKVSKVTPTTLIGTNIIQGFETGETTGARILSILENNPPAFTVEEFLESGESQNTISEEGICDSDVPCEVPQENQELLVKIPFWGVVNIKKFSLPVLSIVLGFVDGFNPCAMWVLVTFLLILLRIGDRRKMWIFAGLFIVAETIMYHLILTLWFTTWDFISLNQIVTPLVGLLAVGSGAFFLYEWYSSDGTCKVTNPQQRKKIGDRIKNLVEQKFTLFTALGVIGLALSVNIIEFACSIGIPQTFTKVLELNDLSWLATEMYILLYILFYMIDDFIVFGIALYSFEKIGLTTKYTKMSQLIGGILMLILGAILIFRPEILASI